MSKSKLFVVNSEELELTAGKMGDHFLSKGITVQRTVPYAHQQNGKSERYIRTIEEGGQALLADAGLPMSFWLDAVLTRQYLVNRLPTSTLPDNLTPFEVLTMGKKPDLSHLRVWGCECFVAIPGELRPKAGFKRFRAIFVGYEDHRTGWRVRDLQGKYSFSNDVVFNENTSGRLGIPRSLPSLPDQLRVSSPSDFTSRPTRMAGRVRTTMGQAYDEVLRLKAFRRTERDRQRSNVAVGVHGGADAAARVVDVSHVVNTNGGATSALSVARGCVEDVLSVVCTDGGAATAVDVPSVVGMDGGAMSVAGVAIDGGVDEISPSLNVIDAFFSLIACASFPDPIDTFSLLTAEPDILWDHLFSSRPSSFIGSSRRRYPFSSFL